MQYLFNTTMFISPAKNVCMRYFALVVLGMLLSFSCGKKVDDDVPIPPGILPPDRFAALLIDFSLAESAATMNIRSIPIQKVDSVYAFDPLTEHSVRKSQYDSTLRFYSAHPEMYKAVYDTVLVRLSEFKTKRNTIKADSTAK